MTRGTTPSLGHLPQGTRFGLSQTDSGYCVTTWEEMDEKAPGDKGHDSLAWALATRNSIRFESDRFGLLCDNLGGVGGRGAR